MTILTDTINSIFERARSFWEGRYSRTATAALLPGTPAAGVTRPGAGADGTLTCEHPSGSFTAAIEIDTSGDEPTVRRAGIVRTARKIMDGTVFPADHRPTGSPS